MKKNTITYFIMDFSGKFVKVAIRTKTFEHHTTCSIDSSGYFFIVLGISHFKNLVPERLFNGTIKTIKVCIDKEGFD